MYIKEQKVNQNSIVLKWTVRYTVHINSANTSICINHHNHSPFHFFFFTQLLLFRELEITLIFHRASFFKFLCPTSSRYNFLTHFQSTPVASSFPATFDIFRCIILNPDARPRSFSSLSAYIFLDESLINIQWIYKNRVSPALVSRNSTRIFAAIPMTDRSFITSSNNIT